MASISVTLYYITQLGLVPTAYLSYVQDPHYNTILL